MYILVVHIDTNSSIAQSTYTSQLTPQTTNNAQQRRDGVKLCVLSQRASMECAAASCCGKNGETFVIDYLLIARRVCAKVKHTRAAYIIKTLVAFVERHICARIAYVETSLEIVINYTSSSCWDDGRIRDRYRI